MPCPPLSLEPYCRLYHHRTCQPLTGASCKGGQRSTQQGTQQGHPHPGGTCLLFSALRAGAVPGRSSGLAKQERGLSGDRMLRPNRRVDAAEGTRCVLSSRGGLGREGGCWNGFVVCWAIMCLVGGQVCNAFGVPGGCSYLGCLRCANLYPSSLPIMASLPCSTCPTAASLQHAQRW